MQKSEVQSHSDDLIVSGIAKRRIGDLPYMQGPMGSNKGWKLRIGNQ